MSFIIEGDCIYVASEVQSTKELPLGNYLLAEGSRGLYLKGKSLFVIQDKIYGDSADVADRYLNTFRESGKGLGILLSGQKGSGKSLMSRLIANKANLPCIVIGDYFKGNDLLNFLTQISQPVVVLIDEFEKIYDTEEKQNDMLSILDGVFSTNKLFVLTSNSADLNQFLLNRPSRIRYHKRFEGLEEDVVLEVVEDLLADKTHSDELIELTKSLGHVTFDTLTAIIQEMNMYSQSAREVIRYLNVIPESILYKATLLVSNGRYETEFFGHPLAQEEVTLFYTKEKDENRWWSSKSEYHIVLRDSSVSFLDGGRIDIMNKKTNESVIFERLIRNTFEFGD